MKKIFAPWRNDYVTNNEKKPKNLKNNCIFCEQFDKNDDAKHLILRRFTSCAVMLNYYPYNAGHLMVLPLEHKPELEDVGKHTRSEMMEAVTATKQILDKTMQPDGYNIGINLGVAGGGGIPSHLHIHVLPRWSGDTNFMATLADTTLICTDFHKIYTQLKVPFENVTLDM